MAREKRKAVAYIRTSSAANVGPDKDSARRQRAAIAAFARRQGFELVDEFNDEAVSGADAIEARARAWVNLVCTEPGRSVKHVIVDGRIVIRDGRSVTIDEDALYGEIEKLMPVPGGVFPWHRYPAPLLPATRGSVDATGDAQSTRPPVLPYSPSVFSRTT